MRAAWRGPRRRARRRADGVVHGRERARTLPLLLERGDRSAPSSCARRSTSTARGSSSRGSTAPTASTSSFVSRRRRAQRRARSCGSSARATALPAPAARGAGGARSRSSARERHASSSSRRGTRRQNLPAVLDDLKARAARRGRARRRRRLDRPHRRRRARARRGGPVARREPRPAASGSPPATAGRSSTTTRSAAASTPTASTRRTSSRACSRSSRADDCDVAVGSRFVSGDGLRAVPLPAEPRAPVRHGRPAPRDGRSCSGGRSATRRAASTPSTRRRCRCSPSRSRREAPEVEALIRITDAGLRLEEVPVNMARARERRVEAPRRQGGQASS